MAISGASGIGLGVKFVRYLPDYVERYIVSTENSRVVDAMEGGEYGDFFGDDEIGASIASGSYPVDAVAVVPCSMNTLAKISHGIADNLTTRVASVAIKERRRLLLAPREMPLSPIALENMHRLSMMGVVISPPIMAYYSSCETMEDMEKFIIGRWYDSLGIEHDLYDRWSGER